MNNQGVRLVSEAGVAEIILDRPPVNALSMAMLASLFEAARTVASDTLTRAVVIQGAGGVLSAGADIREMERMTNADMEQLSHLLQGALSAVAEIPQPVVVVIEGYALGGGLELALAGDIRVCARDARLGLPEVTIGVMPGAGGTQRLPRLVGAGVAADMILTGREISAPEAKSRRLVEYLFPPKAVGREGHRIASELASGPAAAIQAAKRALNAACSDQVVGLALERALFSGVFAHPDRLIGMRRFLSKAPGPPFVGAPGSEPEESRA